MAKKHRVAIVFFSFLIAPAWAATPSPSLIATPPQPSWSELTVPEKIILAPLSDDWDSLEAYRQKMWLGIVARFSSMSALEQRRVQGQMQAWGKLTPDQRDLARKNFMTASQLPAEKKQALRQKWMEYSRLTSNEKSAFMQQSGEKLVLKRQLPQPVSKAPLPAGVKNKQPVDHPARLMFLRQSDNQPGSEHPKLPTDPTE